MAKAHIFVLIYLWLASSQALARQASQTFISPFFTRSVGTTNLTKAKTALGQLGATVQKFVRAKVSNDLISSRRIKSRNSYRADYHFFIDDTRICDYQLTANQNQAGELFVLGAIPDKVKGRAAEGWQWPDLQGTKDVVLEYWAKKNRDGVEFVQEKGRCFYESEGSLSPVYELVLRSRGLAYAVKADDEKVIEIVPLYFDATEATIGYFEHNVESTFIEATVTLVDPNQLTNTYFETQMGDDSSRAFSETSSFVYGESDDRTKETSAFMHANHQLDFLAGFGYNWTEVKPLDIILHDNIGGNKNNALYRPAEANPDTGRPSISLGDGDGVGLTNLDTDEDVVSHEFGHHVLYRYLTSTSGESLVLHEGIADSLAFAKSGSACLGPTICPEESSFCVVKGECLRSGETTLRYDSSNFLQLGAHLKGQVISGLLWDFRKKTTADTSIRLILKAITYLSESAGYRDFLLSLLFADRDLNASANACTITEIANGRGFSSLLTGIDCQDSATWGSSTGGTTDGDTGADSGEKTSSKKKKSLCGVLVAEKHSDDDNHAGMPANTLPPSWFLLVGLLIPVLSSWARSRRQS